MFSHSLVHHLTAPNGMEFIMKEFKGCPIQDLGNLSTRDLLALILGSVMLTIPSPTPSPKLGRCDPIEMLSVVLPVPVGIVTRVGRELRAVIGSWIQLVNEGTVNVILHCIPQVWYLGVRTP